MTLKVCEMYGPVAQGEGRETGRPVFFLRLAGCNLSCAWKGSGCDSWMTWRHEGLTFKNEKEFAPWMKPVKYEDEVHEEDVLDVRAQLMDLREKYQIQSLVVSGGEPLIQQLQLSQLLVPLHQEGWHIQVETNGTFKPNEAMEKSVEQFNVSPKLKSSGNLDILRLRIPILKWFAAQKNADFKFVVSTPEDVIEVKNIVHEIEADPDRVYLMPVGHDRETLIANEEKVYNMALKEGYRYSTRLHVHLFSNTRAV